MTCDECGTECAPDELYWSCCGSDQTGGTGCDHEESDVDEAEQRLCDACYEG